MYNFDEMTKATKSAFDDSMKNYNIFSDGFQAIAKEAAAYTKTSLENNTKVVEKMSAADSVEKAIEFQSEFAKSSFDGFVAQSNKMSGLYSNIIKEGFKPFEGATKK